MLRTLPIASSSSLTVSTYNKASLPSQSSLKLSPLCINNDGGSNISYCYNPSRRLALFQLGAGKHPLLLLSYFHAYNPLMKMPMLSILVFFFMACHIVSCIFGFYLLGILSLYLKMYVVGMGSHLMINYGFKIAFLLISSTNAKYMQHCLRTSSS